MQKLLREYLDELNKRHRKSRRTGIAMALSMVVVIGSVIGVLAQYGIAMTDSAKCGMEEHQHSEECYANVLVCGKEESAGHTHSDECYNEMGELICQQEEQEGHTHTEGCYDVQLTCGKEEHTHTDVCYIDVNSDVEEQSLWDRQYAETEWKDAWGEDLVTAARMQEGYQESINNYTIAEDGSHKGYTRYGQFSGDVYCDWDAAFVNFCMYYAGMKASGLFPDETDTSRWREEFEKINENNQIYLAAVDGYTPIPGDIVFFEREGEETAQQMGIVSSCDAEKNELLVLEGNSQDAVRENAYQINDNRMIGYLKITQMEAAYKGADAQQPEDANQQMEPSVDSLLEEEQAQVQEVIARIEALPAPEEVMERMTALEEAEDEEGYEAYYLELAELVSGVRAAYEALNEKQRAAVTNGEKLQQYEWLETATLEEEPVSESKLKVSLLYGDQKEHPDGAEYYTHATMSGYIKLEPSNLTEDLKNVVVTLTIPKKYVENSEKNPVNIPAFNTNSSVTKYTISQVTEDGENYYISVDFSVYDKTQTLTFPFALSFLDDVVPDNYELPVTASVAYKDDNNATITDISNPLIYKPLYKDWGIAKFVNSNKVEAFQKDGAEVVVTPEYEDGNPYLSNTDYVEFYFRVNNVINSGSDVNNFRDATTVTLTDHLPSYTDKDGNIQTAIFDPEVNSGWEYSVDEDGKETVSKTYTGENSRDVLLQIYNDAPLKLRFPGLKFEQDPKDEKNLIAELDNTVDLLAIPSNEAVGETRPTASDPLHFVITDDPSTDGSLSKQATKGNIYDLEKYKTNPYPWRIRLSNNGVQPLENIQIQDRKIEEDGKVVLSGLNEDLKFVRLESELAESVFVTGRTSFASMVDKVVAYYIDESTGEVSTEDFVIDTVDGSGNFVVEFDKDKVCYGYDIIFEKDFKLLTTEAVSFMAYTVYRDPDNTCVPEGTEKIRYENSARSVNTYVRGKETVFEYRTVTHGYNMLPITENLEIKKQTYANSTTENNMVGNSYRYWISLAGSLFEEKEYGKIYIVDLLPNEVDFVQVSHGRELFEGGGTRYPGIITGVSATPEIEENYHNSGRTALIWELPYETLMVHLNSKENGLYYVVFQIEVKIREDARPGTVRNDIYVVGDNLEEYRKETGGTVDIYDLNNNGRTDDMIAYSHSDAIIVAAESVYAEKFIAPAGSDNWNKQGLSLKVGSEFDYLLKVTNETATKHTGLVIYDTLPGNGDKDIFGGEKRNSEFPVHLREAITPPDGYTVYYTTSKDVYGGKMSDMVSANIWVLSDKITDWSAVTAFKLVANEGTVLSKESPFEVRIPVCVPGELDEESMNLLEKKEYKDQMSGTMAYLQAINSFGYTTKQTTEPKQSNVVWARIPFAGFVVKKVDSISKAGIAGAEFELKDSAGMVRQTAISDENGILKFRDLTEGTYTLTETKFPAGYIERPVSLQVTITQNPTTMEYEVKFSEPFTGTGTSSDPLCIENERLYELPSTGGPGTGLYQAMGILLMTVSVGSCLYGRKKEKLRHRQRM